MRRVADGSDDRPLVEIKTLDDVIKTIKLDGIDYLKIDTEGHDLDVLRGAAFSLAAGKVNTIGVECGTNRDNHHHVSFCSMQSHLEALGYRAFYIVERMQEWPSRGPQLRRVNAIFISPDVIARNRGR
jgi:hypothetical protein